MGGLYTPACKLSGGSRPPKPSGYAPVSRPGPPSSAMAGNGFVALRGSQVSSTSATSPAPTAPPPDTPPFAGRTPCSPTSKTASWPRTAPSRPNISHATLAPSPGASTAASSSKQSTSDWPSPPRRPRQCPIACSNWLRLDGKRDIDKKPDDLPRIVNILGQHCFRSRHVDLGEAEIGRICERASSDWSCDKKGDY